MLPEEINTLIDRMREAVLEPCGMDRFRMRFYLSQATIDEAFPDTLLFMGRPIMLDDTIPYGEFKLIKND